MLGADPRTLAVKDIQHYMRPGTLQLPALPPLSLYVHLPWCLKQVPVLRLQLARDAGGSGNARAALPGRPVADLEAAAAGVGPHGAQHLHRRRHAQPVFAAGH
jgi:hypothetical protein